MAEGKVTAILRVRKILCLLLRDARAHVQDPREASSRSGWSSGDGQ